MPIAIVNQVRQVYAAEWTESKVYVNGESFCWALEDAVRPRHVKIPAKTAIPAGAYMAKFTDSPRFGRNMLQIYDASTADMAVLGEGTKWTGIRPHGGNSHVDTAGCPLVAKQSDHSGRVWDRADLELEEKLRPFDAILWIISEQ